MDPAWTQKPEQFDGDVIVTWPAPAGGNGLPSWRITLHDAATSEPLNCVTEFLLVHAAVDELIWLRAECLVNEDGKPVRDGEKPHVAEVPGIAAGTEADGGEPRSEIVKALFSFRVAEMRIAS